MKKAYKVYPYVRMYVPHPDFRQGAHVGPRYHVVAGEDSFAKLTSLYMGTDFVLARQVFEDHAGRPMTDREVRCIETEPAEKV